MTSDSDIGIDPRLERFECRASGDDVKTILELTCVDCDDHICDVEPDDGLGVLARTALDHHCKVEEARARDLEIGDRFREYGGLDNGWITVHTMRGGDTVIVNLDQEDEAVLDGDEGIEVRRA